MKKSNNEYFKISFRLFRLASKLTVEFNDITKEVDDTSIVERLLYLCANTFINNVKKKRKIK